METKFETLTRLIDEVHAQCCVAQTFEQAAKGFVDAIHATYQDSLALVRVFVTIPFGELPEFNQIFVEALAEKLGVADQVRPQTPVLSLMATRGEQPEWNDRFQSAGHVGIPLISKEFVESIPMIAKLLKDLGMGLDWVDTADSALPTETHEAWFGFFHVQEASRAMDEHNRLIIPMQDFVAAHGVQSVFGLGGGYGGAQCVAIIFFTKEDIARPVVERYNNLTLAFTRNTLRHVHDRRFFDVA